MIFIFIFFIFSRDTRQVSAGNPLGITRNFFKKNDLMHFLKMKCLLALVGIPFFEMPCEFFDFRAFQPKKKKLISSLNNPQNK